MSETIDEVRGTQPKVLGCTIITDPALVEDRAVARGEENMRFRAWVKGYCDMPGVELDAIVRATADEVWRHIDCQACGRCCRLDSITVDGKDIARLARRLAITEAEFSRRHVRKTLDDMGIKGSPCPFLSGTSCSVYEDRPRACHDFPFLHSPEFRSRMLVLVEFSSLCPVVYNTFEVLKRKLGWTARRRRRRR
jgi:uncharacterized protein